MTRTLVLALGLAACSPYGPGPADAGITKMIMEIDYQPDAVPYTGPATDVAEFDGETFQLLHDNLGAIYYGTNVTWEAPLTLDQMGKLPASNQTTYTRDQILEISAAHLDNERTSTTSVVHVLWLDGIYKSGAGDEPGVIGVSLSGTNTLAMFKPVVEGLGTAKVTKHFGEQATLIHEFGHALGLVNNGIPIQSNHHDAEHGAHCTNTTCVMYWTVSARASLVRFVDQFLKTGDPILFGRDCRDDVIAVKGGG